MLPTHRECPTYGTKMSLESFIEIVMVVVLLMMMVENYMKDGLVSDISIYHLY
jgi:hypothetical protein